MMEKQRSSTIFRQLRAALVLLGIMVLLTGVIYPLVITLIAQIVFPHQANGSLIESEGKYIGSELIG
jgi:potassium-transporting ATPase KdpC subunit